MSTCNKLLNFSSYLINIQRNFHVTAQCMEIRKLARLRVVDNSEIGKSAMAEGKPPKCIHIYNKVGVGKIGTIHTLNLNKFIFNK